MIVNWTGLVIFLVLAALSVFSAISNMQEYQKGGKGEFRFLYLVLSIVCFLVSASFADKIFG